MSKDRKIDLISVAKNSKKTKLLDESRWQKKNVKEWHLSSEVSFLLQFFQLTPKGNTAYTERLSGCSFVAICCSKGI